jgi:hypothetical protein
VEPHWLSDGGGGVGVYPPHDYTQLFKIKKKKKKKIKNLTGFAYVIYFTYICTRIRTIHLISLPKKSLTEVQALELTG